MTEKIPSHKDELSYKVIETYCDLLDKHEAGEINNFELDLAVRTLLAATGWGVDKSVFLRLSRANIERDSSFTRRRFFYTAKRIQTLRLIPSKCAVVIGTSEGRSANGKRIDFKITRRLEHETSSEALKSYIRIGQDFTKLFLEIK